MGVKDLFYAIKEKKRGEAEMSQKTRALKKENPVRQIIQSTERIEQKLIPIHMERQGIVNTPTITPFTRIDSNSFIRNIKRVNKSHAQKPYLKSNMPQIMKNSKEVPIKKLK